MKHVVIPQDPTHRLPFYLAMEEHIARVYARAGGDDFFFLWQVDPTVIFGRNQDPYAEVNLEYCRRRNIDVFRRKSGGGCVFANRDNIMFSYITAAESPVETTFRRYTGMIAQMLCRLGLDASATSRNDILVDGQKVSGNAFYHTRGASIVHGTMLFDTNMTDMTNAITPSKSKLAARAVSSVESRITTLRRHLDIDIEQFKDFAIQNLCDGSVTLTDTDLEAIAQIEQTYYADEWIYRTRRVTTPHRRIEGVGEFQVDVATDSSGHIRNLDILGDYFLLGDMDSLIVDRLRGVEYSPQAVVEAMNGFSTENVIYGLTNRQLIELLF